MLWVYQNKRKAGRIEVSWSWLPWFMSNNPEVITVVRKNLLPFAGQEINDQSLRAMHESVINTLCAMYPFPGIRAYLEAVDHVACCLEPMAVEDTEDTP